jgi:peroxin-6
MATELESKIEVSRQDFLSALKELVPSVSQTEMEHYRQVQKKFAEGAHKDEESSTMPNRLVEEEGGDGENMVLGPITKDRKGKGRVVD